MATQRALRQLVPRVVGTLRHSTPTATSIQWKPFNSSSEATATSDVLVSQTKAENEKKNHQHETSSKTASTNKDPLMSACGTVDNDEEDEMEQEEMFVDPHESFVHRTREWGGPTRGGRLAEPTRFGDWERKGRCTDF